MLPVNPKRTQTLRNALLATTSLAVVFVVSSILWTQGYPQWAFALGFVSVWAVIALSWSNADFNEESNVILANIVDHNFKQLHERIRELESQLDGKWKEAPTDHRKIA